MTTVTANDIEDAAEALANAVLADVKAGGKQSAATRSKIDQLHRHITDYVSTADQRHRDFREDAAAKLAEAAIEKVILGAPSTSVTVKANGVATGYLNTILDEVDQNGNQVVYNKQPAAPPTTARLTSVQINNTPEPWVWKVAAGVAVFGVFARAALVVYYMPAGGGVFTVTVDELEDTFIRNGTEGDAGTQTTINVRNLQPAFNEGRTVTLTNDGTCTVNLEDAEADGLEDYMILENKGEMVVNANTTEVTVRTAAQASSIVNYCGDFSTFSVEAGGQLFIQAADASEVALLTDAAAAGQAAATVYANVQSFRYLALAEDTLGYALQEGIEIFAPGAGAGRRTLAASAATSANSLYVATSGGNIGVNYGHLDARAHIFLAKNSDAKMQKDATITVHSSTDAYIYTANGKKDTVNVLGSATIFDHHIRKLVKTGTDAKGNPIYATDLTDAPTKVSAGEDVINVRSGATAVMYEDATTGAGDMITAEDKSSVTVYAAASMNAKYYSTSKTAKLFLNYNNEAKSSQFIVAGIGSLANLSVRYNFATAASPVSLNAATYDWKYNNQTLHGLKLTDKNGGFSILSETTTSFKSHKR